MSTNELSPVLEQAIGLLQAGDPLGAENIALDAVKQAIASAGEYSAGTAHAYWELGSLMSAMQRIPEAIEALRQASGINIPDDSQATRDRLTYMMSLGQLLEGNGQLDEAQEVLKAGLQLREEFYTREHPGYGFGLEPLADVVLRQGDAETALQMVEEVIDNFWAAGHPRVATAFALRSEILKTLGRDEATFAGIEELPEPLLVQLAEAVWNRLDDQRAAVGAAMVQDLLDVIGPILGDQHDAVISSHSALANLNAAIGGAEGRLEAIEQVINSSLAKGDIANAATAQLGLALAYSDAGDVDRSIATYQALIDQSAPDGAHPEPTMHAAALRNLGLLYSEQERNEEAEKTLRFAFAASQGDREQSSKTNIALGIFLQHQNRLDEALPILQQGVEQGDPAAPDSLCGRSHLQALQEHRSCGCGDMSEAIETAFRQFVMQRLPAGLINDVHVTLGDEGWEIGIDAGELSDEETDLVGRTIRQAQVEFQTRMQQRD